MSELSCSVAECPFQVGGTCLEAFDDPSDCPNTSDLDSDGQPNGIDPATDADGAPAVDDEMRESGQDQSTFVAIQTGDSLGVSQANDLRASKECRFILVAGEVGAGKSTLLVQLFGKFLQGPYAGWDFAGSSTLRAFDRVHADSRESSGLSSPETRRTPDEGMRFLHLCLSDGSKHDILLSEISGERFKSVVNGVAIEEAVPITHVADRCLVLVDGELMLNGSTRDRVFGRARRLLGGLSESGGLAGETEVLILATKADRWREATKSEVAEACDGLVEFARSRALSAEWMALAARPTQSFPEEGLSEVLGWMMKPTALVGSRSPQPAHVGRRFWQDRRHG